METYKEKLKKSPYYKDMVEASFYGYHNDKKILSLERAYRKFQEEKWRKDNENFEEWMARLDEINYSDRDFEFQIKIREQKEKYARYIDNKKIESNPKYEYNDYFEYLKDWGI